MHNLASCYPSALHGQLRVFVTTFNRSSYEKDIIPTIPGKGTFSYPSAAAKMLCKPQCTPTLIAVSAHLLSRLYAASESRPRSQTVNTSCCICGELRLALPSRINGRGSCLCMRLRNLIQKVSRILFHTPLMKQTPQQLAGRYLRQLLSRNVLFLSVGGKQRVSRTPLSCMEHYWG